MGKLASEEENRLFFKMRNSKVTRFAKENANTVISFLGLIFCVILFTITSGGSLWDWYNFKTLIGNVTIYMIIALGALFIYSMGYMDVSIGQQLGVYGIILVEILNATNNLFLAFIIVLAISLVCGLFNGIVAVVLKLPSIVTSLFIMFIFTGIQYIVIENSGSSTISTTYDLSLFKEWWFSIIVLVIVALIVFYLFTFTRLGKYTKAIGANEITTQQCGVHTTLWKTVSYMILGACIAIASVFMLAQAKSVGRSSGSGYAMGVMLCIILGGMPLSGGVKSKVRAPIIGSIIYVLLDNGLTKSGIPVTNGYIIKAIIFLVVVALTCRDKSKFIPR